MILAFRIVKSEDRGDTVALTLAEDGIEDPKIGTVIVESDDLPGFKPGKFNFAFSESEGQRPTVMVNGVEMWLNLLQTRQIFEAQHDIMQQAATAYTSWISNRKSAKKNNLANLAMATMIAISPGNDQILMIVAWK